MNRASILITGASGFLGSNLIEAILATKTPVLGMVRPQSNKWRLKTVLNHPGLSLVNVDEVLKDFSSLSVKAVIHTATVYGRRNESLTDIENANYVLPAKLWNLALENRVECFINTDTFMTEALSVNDRYFHYARTKKAFLHYVRNHLGGSNTKFANLVVYHMYGPGDNPEKFLPWVISQMLNKVVSIDLSKGDQIRDFVYIEDVVKAFLKVLDNYGEFNEFQEFEIGFGKGYSIRKAVESLKTNLGSNVLLNWGARPYQTGEIMHSVANLAKNKSLDWQATVDLDVGLKQMAEYCKQV